MTRPSRRPARTIRSYLHRFLSGRPRPGTDARTSRAHKRKQLRTELLEDRRLLAGNIYAYFVSGNGGPMPLGDGGGSVATYLREQASSLGKPFAPKLSFWNGFNRESNPGIGWGVNTNFFETVLGYPDTDFNLRRDLLSDMQAKNISSEDFVVLFGYSLGGEAVLKASRQAADLGIEIDVLGTIDPVSGGAGYDQGIRLTEVGRRWPIRSYNPLENVGYYFNRWQTQYPYPLDLANGQVNVANPAATVSDQGERNQLMNGDLSGRKRSCQGFDYLANNCTTYLFKQDTTRSMTHTEIRTDPGINTEALNAVRTVFEQQTAMPTLDLRLDGNSVDAGQFIRQTDGQSQQLSWSASGSGLKSVDYKLTRNGKTEFAGTTGGDGSINFDDLGPGVYRFEIIANAFHPISKSLSINVRDDDASAPYIENSGSFGTISDELSRQFGWTITDISGIASSSVRITGPSGLNYSSTDLAGVFSLNSHGPGSYQMTVNATDGDTDWIGDQSSSRGFRSVTVYDDDANKPNITFFDRLGQPLLGTSTSESHGLDNSIAWNISDYSGISSANATLRRDGLVVKSIAVDAIGSMSLDEFGIGQFELTLTAADGDNDGWLGDSLTQVSKAYLTVTNQAPTVFVGGPYAIDEGNLLGLDSTGADADPGDTETLAYAWDLNGDGVFGDVTSRNPVLTWQELQPFGMADDGTYPVAVRVEDTFGETAFSSALVTVNNAAPSIVSIQVPPTVAENAPVTLTGSFDDAGSEDTHTVLVDWGDGSTSEASVDPDTRTFLATHVYQDDAPSGTSGDDFTVQVTVTDDDGGVSGDELRSATASTSYVGGIEFPSFVNALPIGTSGLMLEAETTVQPGLVTTSNEPAQQYSHTHTINYPASGNFNLPAVTTTVADASSNHAHSYPGTSTTATITGSSLASLYQRSTEQQFPMNAIESSSDGAPADHDHVVNGATFETSTRFSYQLPQTVISPSTQSNTSYVRLNGDARFSGINSVLTPAAPGKQGTMIVKKSRRTRDFTINFDYEIWYGNGADGMSVGYAPMAENAIFGEAGQRGGPGFWVLLDTFQNNADNPPAIEVWYNGRRYARWQSNGLRRTWTNVNIRVTPDPFRSWISRVIVTHPATGTRSVDIPRIASSSSWRFGFGARTGDLFDQHSLGRTTITDHSPEIRTTSAIKRTSVDKYVLPKFNSSLGTLKSATTTLTLKPGTTQVAPATEVPHDHTVNLQVADYDFVTESFGSESASSQHEHRIEFSPKSLVYSSASPEAVRFAELSPVVVPFTGTTTSTDFGHSHTLDPDSVQFNTTTIFQYDATRTLIRVENVAPVIESLNLDAALDENGTATLTGEFSVVGINDTHQIEVDWGDGQAETLALAFGSSSFAAFHHYRDDDPSGTDGDTYTVTVRIKDDDTGETITTREVAINNLTPTLSAPAGFTVDEGQFFQLPTTRFTDGGVFDTHTVLVDWGDGQSEFATISANAGSGIASAGHTFVDDGAFTISLTVSDDDAASSTAQVPVTVLNLAPEIQSLSGQLSGAEGASLAFEAIAADPGADTLTYHWDFGDGEPPVSGVDLTNVEHLFAADGTYTVRVTVSDEDGGATVQELTVHVADVAARMMVSGPTSVNEGAAYQLTLGEIDDPGNDPIQGIQVNWGDGTSDLYPTPGIVSHTFANGTALSNVQVGIVDQFGSLLPIADFSVAVHNVAPSIESLNAAESMTLEGGTVVFTATAQDAGNDPLTYTWDFGDGSPLLSGLDLNSPSHVFQDDGVFEVLLSVSDDEGLSTSASILVIVENVAPSVTLDGTATTAEGSDYQLSLIDWVDPGLDSVSEVLVDWGDGTLQAYPYFSSVTHTYQEGPADVAIRVSLRDEDGIHEVPQQFGVSIFNVAPTIHSIGGDLTGLEGEQLGFSALASDPAGPFDVLTYRWDWGDGSPAEEGINLAGASHTYADDGSYAASLTVQDDEGDDTTYDFVVKVANQLPQITLAGVPSVAEGASYTFSLGPITDAGDDTVTGFEVSWGDGTQDTYAIGQIPQHVYTDDATNNIVSVSLVDEDGVHADVAQLVVDVTNLAPVVSSATHDSQGTEGDEFAFSVVATDPGVGDIPLFYEWDFGDGNHQSGVALDTVSHVYADDGLYLATLTLQDDDGGSALRNFLVQVENQSPSISPSIASTVSEGSLVTLEPGLIQDPGSDSVTRWIVDWGDGVVEPFDVGDAIEHVYVDGDASYPIEVHAEDEDGFHPIVGTASILVQNAAPTLTLFNDSTIVLAQGGTADILGTFSDSGEEDSHTLEIDWGDGTITAVPAVAAGDLFNASNGYATPGVYNVQVQITDSDGAASTAAVVVDVRPQVSFSRLENGYENSERSLEFVATMPRAVAEDVVLSYTLSGTATPDTDFESPTDFEFTISAGSTEAILTIPIVDDTEIEGVESVVANLTALVSAPQGVTLSTATSAIGIIWDNDPDLDLDGIAASTEDRAANGGDGNLDGVPDRDQPHVASFPNALDGQIVTLVSPGGSQLQNVFASGTLPAEAPEGVEFPWGLIEFELAGIAAGGSTTVELILPAPASSGTFYKFGPTPEDPQPHWYDFSYEAVSGTGAQFSGNTVTLHFVDGQRGDSDLMADGTIVDPGAIAVAVDAAPKIRAGGPYFITQGESVQLSASVFGIDPALLSTWEWDTNYDGQSFDVDLSGRTPEFSATTSGSRTLAVRAVDGNGAELLSTASLTVINLPPVAQADFASTSENELVEIDLLANDADPGADGLSVVPASLQLHSAMVGQQAISLSQATWSVSNGVMTFEPGSDFDFLSGVQSATLVFEYAVEDDAAVRLRDSAPITLTILGENDAPVMEVGSPLMIDDAAAFRTFRVQDFVGDGTIVGSPSVVADPDQGDSAGIMLYDVEGVERLLVSLDDGQDFEPVELESLSLNAAILLPPSAILKPEFSSTSQGSLSYLPWDGSFGGGLDPVDAQLLQDVGQLQMEPGILKLVAVESTYPASVLEGIDFTAIVEADAASLPTISSIETRWTQNESTSVVAGGVFQYQYPNGPTDYVVSPSVTDIFGVAWPLAPASIHVENVAPTIDEIHSSAPGVEEASSDGLVEIVGSFSDVGVLDTHAAVVDWGDGSTSIASIDQELGSFEASHQYLAGGRYPITVALTDNDGGSVSRQAVAFVQGVGLVDGTLYVIGTPERDKVEIEQRSQSAGSAAEGSEDSSAVLRVDARLDQRRFEIDYPKDGVSRIEVVTLEAHDDIEIGDQIDLPVSIDAGAGNDRVDVGSGAATVYAGPGRDRVRTAEGDDFVDGGEGNDDLWTAEGDDTVVDWEGDNEIRTGAGNDSISTGSGQDRMWTDSGDDRVTDQGGNNWIDAGSGNDVIVVGAGDDFVKLGDGDDVAWLGGGDDQGYGEDGNDTLFGEAGDDSLKGGRGNDIVVGGDDEDRIDGDSGLDVLIGGLGADRIDGGADDDLLVAGWTLHDENLDALERIMAEWTSDADYLVRVNNLRTGNGTALAGTRLDAQQNVFDDGEADRLDGDAGMDWFFGTLQDELKKKKNGEEFDLL